LLVSLVAALTAAVVLLVLRAGGKLSGLSPAEVRFR